MARHRRQDPVEHMSDEYLERSLNECILELIDALQGVLNVVSSCDNWNVTSEDAIERAEKTIVRARCVLGEVT